MIYHKGYPGGHGPAEPDVRMQYIFDENSGNIFDEINAVELQAHGAITYNIEAPKGYWKHASKGVSLGNQKHFSAGPQAAWNIDNDKAVIEFVVQTSDSSGVNYLISCWDSTNKGYECWYNAAAQELGIYLEDLDGGVTFFHPSVAGLNLNDGNPHKIRFVIDKASHIEIWAGLTKVGEVYANLHQGKTIHCGDVKLGERQPLNQGFKGNMFEVRLTVGNDTNNSGGDF